MYDKWLVDKSLAAMAATYIHESMRHWPNHRNTAAFLKRERAVMVLQEDDRLPIKLAGKLHGSGGVNKRRPRMARNGSIVGILKEAHSKLGSQDAGHCCVHNFDI